MMDLAEPYAYRGHLYVHAPKVLEFPSEEPWEEAVSETKRHLEARTTLYLLLKEALGGAAVGSDQFVYSDPSDPRRCVSPDVFFKLGTPDATFDTWKVWERGALDVAVEIVSDHDRPNRQWEDKLARYLGNGVKELVRFDADEKARPIRVWDRVEGDLVERSQKDPRLCECMALGLWWVVAPSEFGPMLRLARDREGRDLLPTQDEQRTRLAEELAKERKARSQAEHERMVAEHERAAADKERAADAEARRQAERERDEAMAELAKLRAEAERARKPQR